MTHKFLPLAIGILMAGCTTYDLPDTNSGEDGEPETGRNEIVYSVSATTSKLDIDSQGDSMDDIEPLHSSFNEGDVIFISQMTPTMLPTFPSNATQNSNISNLYPYRYTPNPDATWTEDFNFVSINNPIEWGVIRQNGSIGNGFSFYAMYYPGNKNSDGLFSPIENLSVEEWQNTMEWDELLKQDVLGSYHSTSSLFSRLRFRFFHLTTCLHVIVYVPVAERDNTTGHFTGFDEWAFAGGDNKGTQTSWGGGGAARWPLGQPGVWVGPGTASSSNATALTRNYRIDWRTTQSSDNEPPTVLPGVMGSNGSTSYIRGNICMYPFPQYLKRYDDPETDNKYMKEMPLSYFTGDPNDDGKVEKVRYYEFIAFVPPQSLPDLVLFFRLRQAGVGNAEIGPWKDNTTNWEGAPYTTFKLNKANFRPGYTDVRFEPNTLMDIEVYLPRTGSNVVTLKADVVDWGNTFTQMPLPEEDPE